jgi:hypothetical protein
VDERQQEAFGRAVERKDEEAGERPNVRTGGEPGGSPENVEAVQDPLVETGRPQDVTSVRDKNAGKGKKTADKWNQ